VVADPAVFTDLALVLSAAVVGGVLAWWAGQPLILGYVAGGLLISPFTPGPSVTDLKSFELFAEIGVVLLMFSIGIEFSVKDLLRVRWVALVGGPIGILACIGLGFAVAVGLGSPRMEGAVVGAVISVASTMAASRLLMDRGELHTRHGRVMMGTLLVEDLAVVVLIAVFPAFGALAPDQILVSISQALGKAALVLLVFWLLVARVVPRVMGHVARMHNDELFLLVALALGLGTAALTHAVGLSLALGAFLAGLIISESDYAHETLMRLLSLREAFGALFFVTVGALVDPSVVAAHLPLLGVLVGLAVAGKGVIRTLVVRAFGESGRTAILSGVGLAQIGEFSFVLVQIARRAGHVGAPVYQATLAASLVTILLNALLMRVVPRWLGQAALPRTSQVRLSPGSPDGDLRDHVVLCGFGRVGSAIGEAFETFGVRYVVIEVDPEVVRGLAARGVPSVLGDAAVRRVLETARVERAALVVVAIAEIDRVGLVVRRARAMNAAVPILARAHQRDAREGLARDGATEVIQPELEAAATLIRHALNRLAMPRPRVLAYLERFREAMAVGDAAPVDGREPLPEVADVELGQGNFADQSLREARIRERVGVTVVAVSRPTGEALLNPPSETILRAGDRVRVFGLPEQIRAFKRDARSPTA
jgi:CPA2 family monovalent cation:H+ antiporter-2